MQKKVMKESRISTHFFRRKLIQMSHNQRKAPQVHLHSTSNGTIFHSNNAEKRKYNLQENAGHPMEIMGSNCHLPLSNV